MNKVPITEIALPERAQLLKLYFGRIYQILEIHCNGYIIVFIEGVDEAYIKLLAQMDAILNSKGFEELLTARPHSLPASLHEMGNEADIEWEFTSEELIAYKGKIIRFCLNVNAIENDELEKAIFENADKLIQWFRTYIHDESQKFMKSSTNAAEKIKSTFTQSSSPSIEPLFPKDILKSPRPYLQCIYDQINGCYKDGYYDACAVMIRRLIETLLIECFETKGIDNEIKETNGDFIKLDKIISAFLSNQNWNVSRNSKRSLNELPKVKGIGDLSAHNRRFTAKKTDIDKISLEVRVIIEELSNIAYQ